MTMNNLINSCYLCGNKSFIKRQGHVRDNSSLDILECNFCRLVFLSSFEHITDNFYEESGMHNGIVDINAWLRQTECDDERRFQFLKNAIENKTLLDFGCGNGGFLLKARKIAQCVSGVEPDLNLKEHFLRNNLDIFLNEKQILGQYDIITLFHVLEHIPDPRGILNQLASSLNDGGKLIIEVPSANDALLKLYHNIPFSNFTYWSCHLFLFTDATLITLAEQAGLKVNYVKQIQRYPLSNHLYWLAKGKPGGHKEWSFLDSPELHSAYEKQLASIGCCDTLIASFSKNDEK